MMLNNNFRNGSLKQLLYIVLSMLLLSACNDHSSESSLPVSHSESRSQSFTMNVSNRVDTTPISQLQVSVIFDVTNPNSDFSVSVTDILDREVAGYSDGKGYQKGVILVPDSGIVPISLTVNNMNTDVGAEAKMTLVVSGDNFFSNSQVYDLSDISMLNSYWIEVVPKATNDETATAYAQQTVAMSGSVVASQVNLETMVKSDTTAGGQILDNASLALTIPAGTSFFNESGEPFVPAGTVTASVMLFSADPNGVATDSNNPLYLFPGGLSPDGLLGTLPDNISSPDSVTFISAGFAAIDISDESGNRVSSFSGAGVTVTFEVPKSTINPDTGSLLSIQDGSIPIWSYTETTGKWQYEGDATIVQENAETYTVSKAITHLSYYNLDWYQQNRCQLNVNVVDKNGDANNQKLRLSFAKEGGGWAYKPSGWGDNPEKLEINRVPAFAGHFDLLDSQGNSLLASIEVDGQVVEVADGEEGLDLENFCFGVATDESKSFTATLNIVNPPRISIETGLSLVCPVDTSLTETVNSGRYYLYSGYSYETSGEVSGDTITLSNLIEDGLYRLYYFEGQTWGQVEFTATEATTDIQFMSLALCEKIDQQINTRLVCIDDQQQVFRFKAAPQAYYWMYNRDYYQYLWGKTNDEGTYQEVRAVESVQYEGSGYVRYNDRYYWGERTTVTASSTQAIQFDISLPTTDDFCSATLALNYENTGVIAQSETAAADGISSITLIVQERDQFGSALNTNTGTLSLTATPSEGVSITNIQSGNDGTYSATITSSKAQSVTISGDIDGNALGGEATVEFTAVADIAASTLSADNVTVVADGSDIVTLTVQLKDSEGNNYLSSEGEIAFSLPQNIAQISAVDNQDGTYTGTFSSTVGNTYSIGASINGSAIANTVDVTFVAAFSVSNSSFTLDTASVDADGTSVAVATVVLRDYANQLYIPDTSAVTFSNIGTATVSTGSHDGNGTFTSNISSATAGSVNLTASFEEAAIANAIDVTFVAAFSVSNSSFTLDATSVDADGTSVAVATVVLRDYENQLYTPDTLAVTFSNTGTATVSTASHDGNGTFTSNISSTTAGSVNLIASFDSQEINTRSLTFNSVGPSAATSTLSLDKSANKLDDLTSVTVVLKKADGQDYGQSGGTLSLTSTPSGLTFNNIIDNSDGSYTATVSGSAVGLYSISASVDSLALTNTASLVLTQVDATASDLSNTTIAQDEGDTTNVTLTLRQSDNSLVGHGSHAISVTGVVAQFGLVGMVATDVGDGTYSLALTCNSGFDGGAQPIEVTVDSVAVETVNISCTSTL